MPIKNSAYSQAAWNLCSIEKYAYQSGHVVFIQAYQMKSFIIEAPQGVEFFLAVGGKKGDLFASLYFLWTFTDTYFHLIIHVAKMHHIEKV